MSRIRSSASDPYDFCSRCMPDEGSAEEEFGNVGDGPDGRGNCFVYDDEHPPYEDDEHCRCHECGKRLTEDDA